MNTYRVDYCNEYILPIRRKYIHALNMDSAKCIAAKSKTREEKYIEVQKVKQ